MVGIFGFGRFGELMARYLAEDFSVIVRDTGRNAASIEALGAEAGDLETTASQDILILSVPISALKDTLTEIIPSLKPDALVLDVSSVKVLPDRWLRELLPPSVSYLPTHPMFGPDSAADSLKDRKIVLCPGRVEPKQYDCVRSYLNDKGLDVIETTPETHDREIAVSLALTHFIGRSLSKFGAEELLIDTEGYKRLLHILEVVENDTWQLFSDMNHYNPFAEEVRDSFLYAMEEIKNRLEA